MYGKSGLAHRVKGGFNTLGRGLYSVGHKLYANATMDNAMRVAAIASLLPLVGGAVQGARAAYSAGQLGSAAVQGLTALGHGAMALGQVVPPATAVGQASHGAANTMVDVGQRMRANQERRRQEHGPMTAQAYINEYRLPQVVPIGTSGTARQNQVARTRIG